MSGAAAQHRAPLSWAFVFVAWLLSAWVIAWAAFGALHPQFPWLDTDAGGFAYWFTLKVVVWFLPALWLMKRTQSLSEAYGIKRVATTLVWGVGAGLVFAVANVTVRGALPSPEFSWALVNAALVAPIVEEAAFRGFVLGALKESFAFPIANTITAALFVLAHAPGWMFQGRLMAMLTTPLGGALSIFVLGWLFGWIAHRARSLGAATIAHALNNLSNFG